MDSRDEKETQKMETGNKKRNDTHWSHTFLDCFEKILSLIIIHPWQVCIITFLANGLLGLGMLKFPTKKLLNNDIEDLYVPKNNPTQEKAESLLKLFPDTSGHDFYAHQSVKQPLFGEVLLWRHDRGNILQAASYDEIEHIINYVKNISTFTVNGGYAKYPELCARRNDECVIHGQEIVQLIKNNTKGEIKLDDLYTKGGQHYEDSLTNLALYKVDDGVLVNATYIKLRFYLRHDSEEMYQDSKLWQDHFLTYMKKFIRKQYPESLHIVFRAAGSFYEELGNDTFRDIPFFSLVFTIFLTFIGFVFSGGDAISKRVNIGRIGILVTPMSVLGAWGLLMACEIEFTNIIGCMPLYIQCHQILNSHITLSHISNINDVKDANRRVMYAVRNAGLPITLTAVVHVTAFAPGIMSNYYAVKLVCIYFVMTMLFNYLNHFIFFTAALAIHEQRINAELHFCCFSKLRPRQELQDTGRHWCVLCCCSGKKPETREDTESKIERMVRTLTSWLVLTWPAKISITIGYFVYVSSITYGLTQNNIDAIRLNEVSQQSYYSNWHHHNSMSFGNELTIQFTISHKNGFLKDIEYVQSVINRIRAKSYIQDNNINFWYDTLKHEQTISNYSEVDLINILRSRLFSEFPAFKNDLIIDNNRGSIIVSRVYMRTYLVDSTKDIINIQQDLEKTISKMNKPMSFDYNSTLDKEDSMYTFRLDDRCLDSSMVYSLSFQYTDSYNLPLKEVLKVIVTQFVVLMIGVLFIKLDFILVCFVAVSYLSMVFGVFGLSVFGGIYISQISIIFYMISTWYFVDIIVQTFCSYNNTEGTDIGARINLMINTVSYIIFLTLFGHLLGALILVFVTSYVFNNAFIIYTLMTTICIIHTLYFFPVFLLWLAPGETNVRFESIKEVKMESTNNEGKTNMGFLRDDYL